MNVKVGTGAQVHIGVGNPAYMTVCGRRNKGGYKLSTTGASVTCDKCKSSPHK